MQIAILIFAFALAMIIGFASHRASVCTVRAVAEVMSSRRACMLVSIGKSVLWVWAVTFPFFWLVPAPGAGISGWQLTGAAAAGGFAFGLGAAINGGCAYSTMARFVDGDGRMLAAILGFAVGVLAFVLLVNAGSLTRPTQAPALVSGLLPWSAVIAVVVVLWGGYEAIRILRTPD